MIELTAKFVLIVIFLGVGWYTGHMAARAVVFMREDYANADVRSFAIDGLAMMFMASCSAVFVMTCHIVAFVLQ